MIIQAEGRVTWGSLQAVRDDWNNRIQEGFNQQAAILEADAAMFAPVDRGPLALSVYRVTGDADTYDQAKAAIELAAKKAPLSYRVLPKLPRPPGPSAVVGVAAAHGAPINFGFTHNRTGNHIAANPFWTRAVELSAKQLPDTLIAAIQGRKVFG